MSAVKQTPTQNPAARGLEAGYHYVRVEQENPRFEESKMDEYLDPIDPNAPVYEVVSTDRKVTGNSRMALLRCTEAEYKKHENDVVDRATRNLTPQDDRREHVGGIITDSFTEFQGEDGKVLKS